MNIQQGHKDITMNVTNTWTYSKDIKT